MSYAAILFDHDGTLVDSEGTHLTLWREAIAPFGATITGDEYWQRLLGVPAEQNAADLIQLRQLPTTVPDLVATKERLTQAFLASSYFPAMDSADALVRFAAQHLPIALVSGSQGFCIEASLQGHRWKELFTVVVTADDVTRNKPEPDSYLMALDRLNVAGRPCIAIEDTQSGVRAALAAGLDVVAIRNSHSAQHDFSGATYEVPHLAAAFALLKPLIEQE
ncbi:HAD family phosphatase [Neptunomonas sp. XY-337]|uniref:HAD family hydrolase n=1 Tax=Neptunomonas sp. XY-337 TaxID=2561897 RepID=UPI0010AAEE50|nr:HAD family phosphatase [Neptunomonas sp. XY-337]